MVSFMKFSVTGEEDILSYRRRYLLSFLFGIVCFFLFVVVFFDFVPVHERLFGFLRISFFYLFAFLDYYFLRGTNIKSSADEKKYFNARGIRIANAVCGFVFALNFLLHMMGFRVPAL